MASESDLLVLKVDGHEGLRQLNDVLHDAALRFEDMHYDDDQGLLSITLWRPVFEHARHQRVIPFLYRIDVPSAPCRLDIFAVRRACIQRTDPSYEGYYYLNECYYNANRGQLRITVGGPLDIELIVKHLYAELRDIGTASWDGPNMGGLKLSLTP